MLYQFKNHIAFFFSSQLAMSVFSSVLEVVSAVAVVHSTTVAVMVVVSMLFLYRRLVGGGPTPKQGEVSSMCNFGLEDMSVSLANLLNSGFKCQSKGVKSYLN